MISTRQARVADVQVLAPMFDAYRVFYGNASDLGLAKRFLLERFSHNESIIFIAENDGGDAVGFTQLYPSFSSGAAARIIQGGAHRFSGAYMCLPILASTCSDIPSANCCSLKKTLPIFSFFHSVASSSLWVRITISIVGFNLRAVSIIFLT